MILLIIGNMTPTPGFLFNNSHPFLSFFFSCLANVSVCIFPMDILPRIYHYGYGAPFFNVSQSMRTILFGTRNRGKFYFFVFFPGADAFFLFFFVVFA